MTCLELGILFWYRDCNEREMKITKFIIKANDLCYLQDLDPCLISMFAFAVFMSPVSPVFHTVVTVSIGLKHLFRMGTSILNYWTSISFFNNNLKHLTLFRPTLILGEDDWDRESFQIGVSDLIQLIMEGRLRHPSGLAQYNSQSVTFIDV